LITFPDILEKCLKMQIRATQIMPVNKIKDNPFIVPANANKGKT
jgi:hypothetical protein